MSKKMLANEMRKAVANYRKLVSSGVYLYRLKTDNLQYQRAKNKNSFSVPKLEFRNEECGLERQR